jgi:cytochrome P450
VLVIAEMLGVEPHKHETFKGWSQDITAGFLNPLKIAEQTARGARAQQALSEYLDRVIAARRQRPGADLISSMITADEEDIQMSDGEIRGQTSLLLVAGNLTTSDLIANSMKALLSHPEQLAALRADPELIGNTVEEVLRYDSPVTQANRVLAIDMSYRGCPMHRGESISVSLAGANHDPNATAIPALSTSAVRTSVINHSGAASICAWKRGWHASRHRKPSSDCCDGSRSCRWMSRHSSIARYPTFVD